MSTDKVFIERNLFNRLSNYEQRIIALERRTANLPDLRNSSAAATSASGGTSSALGPFSNAAASDYFQASSFNYTPTLIATRVFIQDEDTGYWWQLRVREVNGVPRMTMQRVREEEVR